MATTLQNISALTALAPGGIITYIDVNPDKNSVVKARYQMPDGSLLLVYNGVTLATAAGISMLAWQHTVAIYLRAQKSYSDLDLLEALVDGVPVPGDGLRWRYCPVMTGVLPTQIPVANRMTDEEGIDYWMVNTTTQETGDN